LYVTQPIKGAFSFADGAHHHRFGEVHADGFRSGLCVGSFVFEMWQL
jgi:hypothetical protein